MGYGVRTIISLTYKGELFWLNRKDQVLTTKGGKQQNQDNLAKTNETSQITPIVNEVEFSRRDWKAKSFIASLTKIFYSFKTYWVIDSSATDHMTHHFFNLIHIYQPLATEKFC